MQIENRKMYQVITTQTLAEALLLGADLSNKTKHDCFFFIEAADSEMDEIEKKLSQEKAVSFFPVNYPLAGRSIRLDAREIQAIISMRLDERPTLKAQHFSKTSADTFNWKLAELGKSKEEKEKDVYTLHYPSMRLADMGIFTLWQDLLPLVSDQEAYGRLRMHMYRADKLLKRYAGFGADCRLQDQELDAILNEADQMLGLTGIRSVMDYEEKQFKEDLSKLDLPEVCKDALKGSWKRIYGGTNGQDIN